MAVAVSRCLGAGFLAAGLRGCAAASSRFLGWFITFVDLMFFHRFYHRNSTYHKKNRGKETFQGPYRATGGILTTGGILYRRNGGAREGRLCTVLVASGYRLLVFGFAESPHGITSS